MPLFDKIERLFLFQIQRISATILINFERTEATCDVGHVVVKSKL